MNQHPQRIEIVGGGLAGLSLGLALRRKHVPVTVIEAGEYPRHRVCGEFINGLGESTIEVLGLADILSGARCHRQVSWFRQGRKFREHELPIAAWAVSRHHVDAALARAFVDAGGELRTGTRGELVSQPGRVIAAGRRRTSSNWVGLKQHFRDLPLSCGLEMHLGRQAYVGLCELTDGSVNFCGLFRGPLRTGGRRALEGALLARGLEQLANRLAIAHPIPESLSAVAGFGFSQPGRSAELRIGDAWCMLPPFLGNGMAAAFQSAELALNPLIAWSGGTLDWDSVVQVVGRRLRTQFRRRQRWGNAVHGFLLNAKPQRWFETLASARCLPFKTLYEVLH